jgi:hypothetical protein
VDQPSVKTCKIISQNSIATAIKGRTSALFLQTIPYSTYLQKHPNQTFLVSYSSKQEKLTLNRMNTIFAKNIKILEMEALFFNLTK